MRSGPYRLVLGRTPTLENEPFILPCLPTYPVPDING
jgi:hypothetical protein